MGELERHPLFERWVCPAGGAVSFLLKNPDQRPQTVPYFTTPAMSADERYLFGYLRLGPTHAGEIDASKVTPETMAPARLLIADLETAECRISEGEVNFPSACLDERRKLFFLSRGDSIFSLDPVTLQERRWFTLPRGITRQGKRALFCTHLSISADGRRLLLDGRYGTYTFLAYFELEEMRFEILCEGRNVFFDHAIYSPTDPHQIVFAHDWWLHPETGERQESDHRIWLVRDDDGKPPLPLAAPPGWNGPDWHLPTHEWWSADGKAVHTILHETGIARLDISSRTTEMLWSGSVCHAQSSHSGRFLVADQKTYLPEPRSVILIDREAGREIPIAVDMPRPPDVFNRLYHLDPHPQISPRETFVIYSSTARGLSDIALAPITRPAP